MTAPGAAAITAGAATADALLRLPLRALAGLLLGCLLFGTSAWANEVNLILVAGEVWLHRAVAGQPVRTLVPVNGTAVLPGDILVTGTTGRLQLRFSDGSLVSLQPQSEFRIDDYRFDLEQQRGFFSLVRGALRTISGAIGKRDPEDYRMTTPTATIGIRGTEFLVEETVCTPACHPGRTAGLRVAVSAGRVVVYNPAGSIEVPAGGATYVSDPARSPVPTTERPTLSTAPAPVDPDGPASPGGPTSTTRVAGLETTAAEPAGEDAPAAVTASLRASKATPGVKADGVLVAGFWPSDAVPLTAPVGDATASNAQRDPAGLPLAMGATGAATAPGASGGGGGPRGSGSGESGGSGGNGGNGGNGGSGGNGSSVAPGTETGSAGSGSGTGPNAGEMVDGTPVVGNPGGGTPGLVPGSNATHLPAIQTLQSPWTDLNLATGRAVATLDGQFRLESIGLCPVLYCLGRNTAQVVEAGYNSDVTWGRWVDGIARITTHGIERDLALGRNNGMHYLVGVPTASMPTGGSAYYAMVGATSPTFASGAVAPGTFTGQGLVQFAAGQRTQVAFAGDLVFGSGERYHLASNGAQTDSAGRLSALGATEIHMTGRTTFHGNIGVVSQGSADRLGCASSNCRASIEGGFYGAQAARMGLGYTVGRTGGGGDTINGVVVLNRE